jgi:hypothetical protein
VPRLRTNSIFTLRLLGAALQKADSQLGVDTDDRSVTAVPVSGPNGARLGGDLTEQGSTRCVSLRNCTFPNSGFTNECIYMPGHLRIVIALLLRLAAACVPDIDNDRACNWDDGQRLHVYTAS